VQVTSTPGAEAVVRKVAASGREDLTIVLGTGCCDSTAPFLYDNYVAEANSEPVGEIAGVPILAPEWIRTLYPTDDLMVDVIDSSVEDSFSLETDYDRRFVLRAPGNEGLG
jgi:uncharacterized protein (DUF779 family)